MKQIQHLTVYMNKSECIFQLIRQTVVVHSSEPALPSTLPSPPLTHTVVQECITLGNLSRHSHAHRLDKYNTHFQSSISGYYRIRHHLHHPYITTPTHTTSSPQLTLLYLCVCAFTTNCFHYTISPPCTISIGLHSQST